MSVRVGRIMRHEDVHGVSGVGDHIADVFEASDGTTVVRWLGKDGSTNVYGGVKNVTNVHGHGGKTDIEWLWEQEEDADPMDAVFEKKILEAGGSTAPTGPVGSTARRVEAEREAEAEEIADALVDEAAETVDRVAGKLAEKLLSKASEKSAEKIAENAQAQDDSAEE